METAPQTCYRHPGNRAGVRCQRCNRLICPDCMHQASVGFHCPECTHQGRQQVVRASQLRSTGGVSLTNILIGINLAIYVFGMQDTQPSLLDRGALYGPLVASGEWYRIVTSGFLHVNALHVGMNCFVLYQLGLLMEPVLGRFRFGLVYLVSLLSGSLGVLLLQPHSSAVGASGAIFGIMGAAVAAMRSRGINPFQTGLGGTIMLNLLITFIVPNIAIGAHIGGLVGGFVAGWIITDVGPSMSKDQRVPTAVVALLGVAVAGGCLLVA